MTLLESGRIDAAEIPTTTYLHDAFLKKSKVKRLYKGIYLAHSPMSYYSRSFFKPFEILLNKTYDIPVPNQFSPERFFAEKFIESYFPDKYPKLRFVETPYYLVEKYLRSSSSIGCSADPLFCPFLNKFQTLEEKVKEFLPDIAGKYIPTTMLVFSGQFVANFPKETENIIRTVKDSIEFLNLIEPSQIDELISDTNILNYYPHYRFGELKQLLLQNRLKDDKIFHWKGDAKPLAALVKDHFFQGIKRVISEEEVDAVLNFTDIWKALDTKDETIVSGKSFQNPGALVQYSPSLVNYRKQNYTRHLITDAISISLDILEGNIHSRLNIDESLRIDNRVRIHINNMLDYFQSELFKLNERTIELENINSILEIKLDRSSVNLQYSEERYRYLFEFSREALIIVDSDSGEIIESNLQFRLMSGYSRTELSRIKIDDVIVGQKLEKEFYLDKHRTDSMLNIPNGEMILKDGTKIGVDISINSMLVSPRKRYQIILKDNRERIESEKAKHEFISNISHELRSPMTNIRGYFELLTEDPAIRSKPENSEMLDIIDKNIKRLSFLIENLLKIEKDIPEDEDGTVEIFDPAVVVEDVIHMNSHLFNEKKLRVIQNLEKGHLIKAIRFEFSQIVSNLFVNAIKYTPSGEVEVSLQLEKDMIVLVVKDSGIGIPEKYKNSIFDRFFRIPSNENKKIGGTGLGLSITRSLVEKMGGEISVVSELGTGSIFKVEVKQAK
ncbi:MAG: PAS domain S-box protein [Leptospira sp.]|nr:PAS domain S-box protein [Leptospira sp.]